MTCRCPDQTRDRYTSTKGQGRRSRRCERSGKFLEPTQFNATPGRPVEVEQIESAVARSCAAEEELAELRTAVTVQATISPSGMAPVGA
jgi:hypothetical protein